MSGPYRDTTLVPPKPPPFWQRVVARLAPNLYGAGRWSWYRCAVGGRWAPVRVALTDRRGASVRQWRRVEECPGNWQPYPPSAVVALAIVGIDVAALHNDTIADHRQKCTCEVYPW